MYVVKNTLFVPKNSRLVGEAWAVITGMGSAFKNANSPQPIVKVGNSGDVGVAHISDMRFSVAEPLAGAISLQINMAGSSPGDVGVWNTQVTIGGTRETSIRDVCNNQDTSNCMAAFLGVHLTKSSSAYLQNIWIWTADHNLDGGSGYTVISTGRGLLCEATKGTWLVGTGAEHNWLYNYNFNGASNVFAGLLQTESPYMQGDGATKLAPAPCKLPSAPLASKYDTDSSQGRPNPPTETPTSPGAGEIKDDVAPPSPQTLTEAPTYTSMPPRHGLSSMVAGMETTATNAAAIVKKA